ncbi:oligosaccharide flippase family protein [uncultured Duncaniella sp.]
MFKRQEIRGLMGLGIRFFMIQIGGVVLMSISNIIISHQFGPQEVTPYNITYRYFSTVLLIFGIIITPVWSATTDAYHRKDIEWIRSCSKRISKINILFLVGLVFMVLISKWIYSLWIGNEVFIPLSMSVLMACFTYSSIWNWTYSNFLCGLGKLNIISGYVTIILILYYPLSIYLSNLCGINGVITSILILNSIGAVLYFTQFHQIIKNISN